MNRTSGGAKNAAHSIFIKKILDRLERHTPEWLVCLEIQILLWTTARAFGVPGKRIHFRQAQTALQEYAAFTRTCMQTRKADPERLYREAYRTGSIVRRVTGFTRQQDRQQLTFYLYRNLRILMDGRLPGEVTVTGCYFSRFYTPGQCALMSNVDSGMVAGLMGGGRLEFSERITEGCRCCRAFFSERSAASKDRPENGPGTAGG